MLIVGILVLSLFAAANASPISRIVGGTDAPEGKYPYQVSIWRNTYGFQCGGSIVNERYILTAAHCLFGYKAEAVSVITGSRQLFQDGTRYQAEKLVVHNKFNMIATNHDIALIRLNENIVYTDKVQPIELPTENLTNENDRVVLTGWGRLWGGGPVPDILQEIELRVISEQKCRKSFRVTPRQICTSTKTGEGACNGDSGGPLVADGIQLGIVSYGKPCAIGYPDVYTRVYSYLDWIADTMEPY